jgi:hypothetical protein
MKPMEPPKPRNSMIQAMKTIDKTIDKNKGENVDVRFGKWQLTDTYKVNP